MPPKVPKHGTVLQITCILGLVLEIHIATPDSGIVLPLKHVD